MLNNFKVQTVTDGDRLTNGLVKFGVYDTGNLQPMFETQNPATNASSREMYVKMLNVPSDINQPGGGSALLIQRRVDLQEISGIDKDQEPEVGKRSLNKVHYSSKGMYQTKPTTTKIDATRKDYYSKFYTGTPTEFNKMSKLDVTNPSFKLDGSSILLLAATGVVIFYITMR